MRHSFPCFAAALSCLAACGTHAGVSPWSEASTLDGGATQAVQNGTLADGGGGTKAAEGTVVGGVKDAADLGPGGDFKAYADAVAAQLQRFYSPSAGTFAPAARWTSATALLALVDYSAATRSTTYVPDVAATFAQGGSSNFIGDDYGVEGAWALTRVGAYDLTGDARYLATAKAIFADMAAGWNSRCSGGLDTAKSSAAAKPAMANAIFVALAVRLHERTRGDAGAGSYFEWANRSWAWFAASGLVDAHDQVKPSLDGACAGTGASEAHAAGYVIAALVELAQVKADPALLARARAVADGARALFADAYSVAHDRCEPSCTGDGPEQKGVLMRYVGQLAARAARPADQAFLATNADWIWNAGRAATTGAEVGLSWSGPLDATDPARQSAALAALVAAVPYASAQANLALHKIAVGTPPCSTGEVATNLTDGVVASTSKWCSGGAGSELFVTVDLGAPTPISRVILRHAGAGGEEQGWNTRDFRVSVSLDDAAYATMATVTANTLPVTIHRFAMTTARYVRVDITGRQTDTSFPAARIDELEVYTR